jgi:ABC-2 type transport system permease protein
VTLFLRQYRSELIKLFARKRTWMGFGAFIALELILLALFQLPWAERAFRKDFERNIGFAGMDLVFDDYFRGLTLATAIVAMTVVLLGALFLALVAGDIVSKEVEDGTLRMTLCRPSSRLRVLGVKYLTCLTYTMTLGLFIGASALLVGWLWRGLGGIFVFVPEEKLFVIFGSEQGLIRFCGLVVLYAVSVCTITSLAFLFSCSSAKPAAATVMTLVVMLIDRILYGIPQFEPFRPWFLTSRMVTCVGVFRDPIPWDKMLIDYVALFGVKATFVIIGCALFCRRDFKS